MTKKVQIGLSEDLSDPWPIARFRDLLEKIESEVPEPFRQSVTLEFTTHGYDIVSVDVESYYERPETESEASYRLKAEDARKQYQKQVDLRRLAELKKQYESGES